MRNEGAVGAPAPSHNGLSYAPNGAAGKPLNGASLGAKPAKEKGAFSRFWSAITGGGEPAAAASAPDPEPALDGAEPVSAEKQAMLERVIAFDTKRVEHVMVPRADIVAVDLETGLQDLLSVFHEAAHSRLPIYRESLDDPIGMVHIKDVVGLLADPEQAEGLGAQPILNKVKREILFAPPSMPVTDLLLKMQTTRIHIALVVDEYGGTDGLVSIEDLVEEIVGEIRDEHDEEEEPVLRARDDGGYDADARVELPEFETASGWALMSPDGVDEDIDTLGGMVFSLAGRVPQRGEVIVHPGGVEFEVVEADPRRIRRLRVSRTSEPEPSAADALGSD